VFRFKSFKSFLLVLLQFVTAGYILITDKVVPDNLILLIIFILSLLTGIYAILIMKFNFNIAPDLKTGAIFVYKGPYRYIRHPMYATLIVSLLCLIINYFTIIRLIAFLVLFSVLFIKMIIEEKILSVEFDGYKDYILKTKRIIPFIY
jgi:protein-S-isoprenylcysteine O-methyltransferase Ste14